MSASTAWFMLVQLGLASLGVCALAALAFLLRAAARRDAVLRHRVSAAFMFAALLLLPVQFAAALWSPPWANWLTQQHETIGDLFSGWSGMISDIHRSIDARPPFPSHNEDPLSSDSPAAVSQALSAQWAVWTLGAYIAGCGAVAGRRFRRYVRLQRLLGRCQPITSTALLQLWRRINAFDEFARPIRLLQSEEISIPACVGGSRPAIIIPAIDCSRASQDELRFALLHERAHLRRRDWMVCRLQGVAQLVFWFHPLIWLLSRAVDRDREASCDAMVIRATRQPRSYAMALLAFCERQALRRAAAAEPLVGFGSRATLRRRLHMIANANDSMNESRQIALWGVAGALACCTLLAQYTIAAVQGQAQKNAESQAFQIKTTEQESGVIKQVQIDAPAEDRDPAPLLRQMEAMGRRIEDGSITDQETIVSAWRATLKENAITADELNLALPEGSKLKAVIAGDRITITPGEDQTQIAVVNARVQLVDVADVTRVTVQARNLTLRVAMENGEIVFVASSPDRSEKVRVEIDRTTGVPQSEEQPPHGAVRYNIQPSGDVEDEPTRLKMQWIYDVGKLRAKRHSMICVDEFGQPVQLESGNAE